MTKKRETKKSKKKETKKIKNHRNKTIEIKSETKKTATKKIEKIYCLGQTRDASKIETSLLLQTSLFSGYLHVDRFTDIVIL